MLKNSHFLYGRKTLGFHMKLAFCTISITSHVSKYIQLMQQMQQENFIRISVFWNMWGSRNNEKKLVLWENLMFFFLIKNVRFLTFLMYRIFQNLIISRSQSLQDIYYLVPINSIFDGLSFGIRFIIYFALK